MRSLSDLLVLDEFDPEVLAMPAPMAATVDGNWCGMDPWGSFLVWGYHQALEVLDHPALTTPVIEESSLGMLTDGPGVEWTRLSTSFLDGPEHRQLRLAMAPAFRGPVTEDLRPTIRAVARSVVDRARELGECDLVHELTRRYPLAVFAELMGTNVDTLETYADDVDTMTRLWSYSAGEHKAAIDAAVPRLETLADELRGCPVGMVERIENLALDDALKRSLVMQLLVAGWETTSSQAAGLLWLLISELGRWTDLVDHDLSAVVSEGVRLQPAAAAALRFAREDTIVGDVQVPAGTRVIPSLLWGSRDRETFDRPDDWIPSRYEGPAPAPAPLAFSAGRHACLGERLAMLELEELLRAAREIVPAGWDLVEIPAWTDQQRPRRPVTLRVRPTAP